MVAELKKDLLIHSVSEGPFKLMTVGQSIRQVEMVASPILLEYIYILGSNAYCQN